MIFDPPLKPAKLISRYKRFLAVIEMPDNNIMTLHCANTGAMTGCAEAGNLIWYSTSDNPKRKYPNSWEISVNSLGDHICVNTARANTLAVEAILSKRIPELIGYAQLRTEVKYGKENSRIDILLEENDTKADCYIEVKSVTLLDETNQAGQGYFPDAETLRGQKHLRELIEMVDLGYRSVLFFAVLHTGVEKVSAAHHIDLRYSQLLKKAKDKGVEILCYKASISPEEILLHEKIEFIDH